MTLREIVEQLRWCGYECVAGRLEDNEAFRELEAQAKAEDVWRQGEAQAGGWSVGALALASEQGWGGDECV